MSRDDELIGLAQAAEEFDLNHTTLRRHVNDGLLQAKKTAGVWLVTRSEIKRYLKDSKPQMGRPLKEKSS